MQKAEQLCCSAFIFYTQLYRKLYSPSRHKSAPAHSCRIFSPCFCSNYLLPDTVCRFFSPAHILLSRISPALYRVTILS